MDDIGKRLEIARIAAGFGTPDEAASALGIPYSTYRAHENGTGLFKLHSAVTYAKRFKVTLDWLVRGKGKGPGPRDELLESILELWPKLSAAQRKSLLNTTRVFAGEEATS